MTVYVDSMRAEFRRMKMCHMIADTLDELHAMADRIGLKREWFQKPLSGPHYDVALSKRALAVQYGAVEITWRQAGLMTMVWRVTGVLGHPDTCATVADFLRRNRCSACRGVRVLDDGYTPCAQCGTLEGIGRERTRLRALVDATFARPEPRPTRYSAPQDLIDLADKALHKSMTVVHDGEFASSGKPDKTRKISAKPDKPAQPPKASPATPDAPLFDTYTALSGGFAGLRVLVIRPRA